MYERQKEFTLEAPATALPSLSSAGEGPGVRFLSGQYVYLQVLNPSHVTTLCTLARDTRLWEYTKTFLVNDSFEKQFDTYITNAFDERYMGIQKSFVIYEAATNRIIGMTRYYKMDLSNKRVSIGFTWYIPEVWGNIHNKECKLLLLQYAFEELKLQRVEFEVAHQNIRSQKAVAKIGGIQEGVLRKHGRHADGTIRHTIVFSIIDDEWPSIKTKLQKLIAEQKYKQAAKAFYIRQEFPNHHCYMKFIRHIPPFIYNKYFIATAFFAIWMLFFDRNDFFTQMQRKKELAEIEESKAYFARKIAEGKKFSSDIQSNAASVEKFVREKYLMKRDNEDLFLVQKPAKE